MNGKAVAEGVKLRKLMAPDFVHYLMNFYVEDMMLEKEMMEHRDKMRARIMSMGGYDSNSNESYGMTNDDFGPHTSEEPLPYIEPTAQTDDGYVGLGPPMN